MKTQLKLIPIQGFLIRRSFFFLIFLLFTIVLSGCATAPAKQSPSVSLDLLLDSGQRRSISVSLGQSAMQVADLCRPAKVYADDDPWIFCPAAGGGIFVFFFTCPDTKTPCDAGSDQLYAVALYTTQQNGGAFLLPESMKYRTYGEFLTLRLAINEDETKIATIALKMTPAEVKTLFSPAQDLSNDESFILYRSVIGGTYLLLFSPPKGERSSQPEDARLSTIIYERPGEEAHYLLPSKNRGKLVPPEYQSYIKAYQSK